MITIRIYGGLGNQMFQYALGYALGKKRNDIVVLDTSFYKSKTVRRGITPRNYELIGFRLPREEHCEYVSLFIRIMQLSILHRFLRFTSKDVIRIRNYYLECKYRFHESLINEIVSSNSKNIYIDGYWHCEKYFNDYRQEILKLFSFDDDTITAEYNRISLLSQNTVAVHIRRGDYVSNNNPNLQTEDYYKCAMTYMQKHLENLVFCIFSDDLGWAKKAFQGMERIVFVNEEHRLTDIQELQVMRKCNNAIISNSSFSWWGAWLIDNENKIIIAPKTWQNKEDMMPLDWIRI